MQIIFCSFIVVYNSIILYSNFECNEWVKSYKKNEYVQGRRIGYINVNQIINF